MSARQRSRPLTDEQRAEKARLDAARRAQPSDDERLAALHKAWMAAADDERAHHLIGALRMCGPFRPLPEWLFKALDDQLIALDRYPQEPGKAEAHWRAWATAESKQPVKEAVEALKGTKWEAGAKAVRKSVTRVNKRLGLPSKGRRKVGTNVGA